MKKQHKIDINPHYGLSVPLGNIAILCHELGLPLLSVRVQYKEMSSKTAEGFYTIAYELKPEYKDISPNETRSRELQLTRECKDWSKLEQYLAGKPLSEVITSAKSTPSIHEQIFEYVDYIIGLYGRGHTISSSDLSDYLKTQYGTNDNSILPADFSYNRWNKGIDVDHPAVFEFIKDGEYKVFGLNYLYNGPIMHRPKGGDEYQIGYCFDGKRVVGKFPVYPDEIPTAAKEYLELKQKSVLINTYERNPVARQACIDHYGAACCICGFNFASIYGEAFEGMIHVHHLKMISEAEKEYKVDPINDLRPVCPNCHMVLHSKKDGVYSIEEVKKMLG